MMRHPTLLAALLTLVLALPALAEDEAPAPPSAAPAAEAPAPAPEVPAPPEAVEVVVEEPPATPLPPPSGPTVEVTPVLPPSGPTVPSPLAPAVETTPTRTGTVLETAVLDIRKTHNLPWRCYCSAVRLDVDFMVVGQKGRHVGARVDFYDQNGQPIKSVLYPFANERGQVSAWTSMVLQTQDVARMHTALMIPYRAFPCACKGDHYVVTARVTLIRREARSTNSEIARGETTFTVWSSPEELPETVAPAEVEDLTAPIPEGEYRPQEPFGEWPDHTEMEEEWHERTREASERASTALPPPSPTPPAATAPSAP